MSAVDGSFQSDPFADLAILHKRSDGGVGVHVLYGNPAAPFSYNPTIARDLPGTAGWSWKDIKASSGDYNGDGYSDVALVHKISDGGADVHVIWGGSGTPFASETSVRHLPASDGWNWSDMQVVSGKYQSDNFADLAILEKRADGGVDVNVLYGNATTPLSSTPALARSLPGTAGWSWKDIKASSGDYNGDGYSDVALVHKISDGGADVHVIWGGNGTPFASETSVRHLPASDGWNWNDMTIPGAQLPNSAPVIGMSLAGTPNSATGVVTGSVKATDPEGDALTYTATASRGTASITNAGAFTYTPTATARHAAARIGAGSTDKTDTVMVTVTDAKGASSGVGVPVVVLASNTVPTATKTIGTPNNSTGVVTGTVVDSRWA